MSPSQQNRQVRPAERYPFISAYFAGVSLEMVIVRTRLRDGDNQEN